MSISFHRDCETKDGKAKRLVSGSQQKLPEGVQVAVAVITWNRLRIFIVLALLTFSGKR